MSYFIIDVLYDYIMQGSHATRKTGKVHEIEYYAPGPGEVFKLDKCGQSLRKVREKKHVPSWISNPNDNNNQLDSIQFGFTGSHAFWSVFVGHMINPELRLQACPWLVK